MKLELMSKEDLIEDYKKKERESNVNKRALKNDLKRKVDALKKKDEALQKKEDESQKKKEYFHNILQQKDDDIKRKDDDIRRKDDNIRKKEEYFHNILQQKEDALQKKDAALEHKDIIIKEKEASIEQYKNTTSEREMNHFLSIIQDFQESEQTTLNRASSCISDYVTFFVYCFNIDLSRCNDPINKGKTLLWKFGDWVIEDHERYVPTAIRFLCKSSVRYISSREETRAAQTTNSTRGFSFEFKEMICFDWMHKLNPKIDESTNNSLLLNCLLRIHSSPHNIIKEAGNFYEDISSQIFFATLFNELKLFLSVLNEMSELKIHQEERINHGVLDGILYDRGKACIVVEMKRVQLFRGEFSNRILLTSLKEEILQITNYMIECGCSRGLLSDSFNYILIEIDPSVKEHNRNSEMTLKYKYVNAHSSQPSLLEVLLGFIQESIEDDESGKRVKELNTRYPAKEKPPSSSSTSLKRKRTSTMAENLELFGQESGEGSSSQQESSTRPSTAESYQDLFMPVPDTGNTELTSVVEEPDIKIQYEKRDTLLDYTSVGFTRVLKSKAKYFQNILETDIDPEETIIVKIYLDLFDFSEKEAEEAKESIEAYKRERECVMRLSQDPEYHNCYLQHSEAYVEAESVNEINVNFMGNVILSRYAGERWDGRSSSRQEIEKQLEVIHRNRIAHGDIWKSNILYNETEEKVYIIDFSHSWLYDPEIDEKNEIDMFLQEDWRCLRYLYEHLD